METMFSPTTNLAPVRPLQKIFEDKVYKESTYVTDGVRDLIKEYLQRDKEVWREIARTSEVTSNFIQGKQIWARNYWTNEWRVVPLNRADPNKISSINIMQFYCTSQIKMITSSNPDLEPEDSYPDRAYKQKILANKAVWNRYESKFYTSWFNQQQALHMIIGGTYFESVRYNEMLPGPVAFRDIFAPVKVMTEKGGSTCFSCGFEGKYEDFVDEDDPYGKCPECGSMEITPPKKDKYEEYQSFQGREQVKKGELELRLIPVQTVRFDLKKKAEESSWFLERMVVPKAKLQYLLGGNERMANESMTDDDGIKSLDSIQKAGNTLMGQKNPYYTDKKTDPIIERLSVKPEDLAHIIAKQDEQTVSGFTIKKGTRLSDLCPPEGMTILASAEGRNILGMYPKVHHSKELSTGVYHMRFESGIGRASEDTVEVQKRFNRFDAQAVKYMELNATPAHMYVKGAVDEEFVKHIGNPQKAIPINKEVAMAMNTMELVKGLPPNSMSAQFLSYTYDILNQYRQLTSHSTDFTNAFPGVNNTTATGARLAKSNADSVFSPTLQVKAEARTHTARNTICLYALYFRDVMIYHKVTKRDSNRSYGQMISGADVDPSIPFTVVRDSEQPKTMYDRQLDFVNMMAVANQGGGWQILKQSDPKLVDALLKAFDIDIDDDVYDTISDVNEQRLEESLGYQKAFSQINKAITSSGGAPMPVSIEDILQNLSNPIILEESNHMQKAKWYMEYIDSVEGQQLKAEEKQVLAAFVRAHFQMEVQQQTAIAQGFMQAQGIDPNEPDKARAAEQEAADQEMSAKAIDKEIELAREEGKRSHEIEKMKLQGEQAKEQAALDSVLRTREAKELNKTGDKNGK